MQNAESGTKGRISRPNAFYSAFIILHSPSLPHRLRLVLGDREDRAESGDFDQALDARLEVRQAHLAAALAHLLERLDKHRDRAAVHVGHLRQIEHEALGRLAAEDRKSVV